MTVLQHEEKCLEFGKIFAVILTDKEQSLSEPSTRDVTTPPRMHLRRG